MFGKYLRYSFFFLRRIQKQKSNKEFYEPNNVSRTSWKGSLHLNLDIQRELPVILKSFIEIWNLRRKIYLSMVQIPNSWKLFMITGILFFLRIDNLPFEIDYHYSNFIRTISLESFSIRWSYRYFRFFLWLIVCFFGKLLR